ncbi:hypothetical protein FVA81_01505 (plasmid) [Rhizobium sp. WL3]|uniref:hypothetical protein n=1 Tax=Rhizobium sp. WL3 TaxID=2603277 RepID=UPI0011C1D3B0|nr:hypothetical protein [Rhizobium sp. WL3]QEE43351.1 hypothetical protein FVA81_01505 [Rhizobium sp. WL3]
MSSAAVATEQVDNGGFDGGLGDWKFSSPLNNLASQVVDAGVVDTGGLFNVSNYIAQVLTLEVGRYTFSFDGFFNGGSGSSLFASIGNSSVGQLILKSFTGSEISGAKSYEFDVAAAGNYRLLFLGNSTGFGSAIAVDNVSVSPVVAVPGPEAGAGLAGLAMAGMYVWASRRRKSQAAA